MRVAHADDENEDGTAAAWVCVSEEGIWLSYNAHVIGPDGPNGGGMQGQEDPLSSIEEIVFA